jgi:hypothetical protein
MTTGKLGGSRLGADCQIHLPGVRQVGTQLSATSHQPIDRPRASCGASELCMHREMPAYLPERLDVVPVYRNGLTPFLEAEPHGTRAMFLCQRAVWILPDKTPDNQIPCKR